MRPSSRCAAHARSVTNGITPRRWLLQCNPALAALITKTLGSDAWLTDLTKLERLQQYADDHGFQKAFLDAKQANKVRLANYITRTTGLEINPDALFDIQVKRLHEYKRQVRRVLDIVLTHAVHEHSRLHLPLPRAQEAAAG